LWPGILDDAKPEERTLGIEAGLAWGPVAQATVVYVDRGISESMWQGIDRAEAEGRLVEWRSLHAAGDLSIAERDAIIAQRKPVAA
jgi:hypothetical protein